MLPILVYLYGLAGFLCLLGYLYALVEWYLRQRQLRWQNRVSIEPLKRAKRSDGMSLKTDSEPKLEVELTTPFMQPSGSAEMEENSMVKLQEDSTEKAPVPDQHISIERCSEEPQSSWELRRAERRQRYKEEKCRQLQESDEPRNVQTVLDDSTNVTPTPNILDPWESRETDKEEIADGQTSVRKYSIPEEVRAAHLACSRRTSVQLTDLDDQLQTATIHMKECVYGLGESAPIPIAQP